MIAERPSSRKLQFRVLPSQGRSFTSSRVCRGNRRRDVFCTASRKFDNLRRRQGTSPLWVERGLGQTDTFGLSCQTSKSLIQSYPWTKSRAGLTEQILSELHRPKYYPYSSYRGGFRGAQGIYLTKLTTGLTKAFRELADFEWPGNSGASKPGELPNQARKAALEFAEGERSQRESTFFRRNPRLREEAIKHHGLRCIACGLDFGERYGSVATGYIEIHHLNPLAERRDAAAGKPLMTLLDDVKPLCANCHRVVHRRQPPMSIAELRACLERESPATPPG
jgi:hypothetical protein